eukprot:TRINITY_DN913_c0_g1_i6.p1 TRINITY_DN913_c0_g1~~TRINITY_DN913_c0_g1_i6.p1  ORF type:complete len:655 (+),score=66.90 TRINITY_DN913_c0_g1_i6:2405-4369(+)
MNRRLYEPFDERFADYGRNKIQFFFDLNLRGFKFRVLPFPFFVIHENHDDSKWRVDFIDPATRAKEKSSELWSNYQQRRKAFFELQIDAQADVLREDMAFRRASARSARSYTEIAGSAAAEEVRLKKLALNAEATLAELSTACGTTSPSARPQISYLSHLLTGLALALPALIGLLLLLKRNALKSQRSLAVLACSLSLIYLLTLQLHPELFLSTSAPSLARPIIQLPDMTFLALTSPKDLTRLFCLAQSGDEEVLTSVQRIISLADVKYLSMSPRTVMIKEGLAPSGSKHDFFSRTFYVPGRDGEMHPDVFSHEFDKTSLWDLELQTLHLGIAYLITGEEKYGKKLADAVYDWFLNPLTYMTPHFLYASTDVDSKASIGRQYGLVEAHPFKTIVEMVSLVSKRNMWSNQNSEFLRIWLSKLAIWYQTSEFGHLEEKSGNNHQTGFYVMLSWMLTIQGDAAVAKRLLERAKYKLVMQFHPDGSQPRELKRPDAWWYVGYNIMFMTEIAAIAEHVGVDIWRFEYHGRGIVRALDWMLSHLMGCEKFKYGTHPLSQADLTITVFPAFRRAALHLRDPRFEIAILKLADKFGIDAASMLPSFSTLMPPYGFSAAELQKGEHALSCENILASRASKYSKSIADETKAATLREAAIGLAK